MSLKDPRSRALKAKVPCSICQKPVAPQGMWKHQAGRECLRIGGLYSRAEKGQDSEAPLDAAPQEDWGEVGPSEPRREAPSLEQTQKTLSAARHHPLQILPEESDTGPIHDPLARLKARRKKAKKAPAPPQSTNPPPSAGDADHSALLEALDMVANDFSAPASALNVGGGQNGQPDEQDLQRPPCKDDIKVEHHPRSGRGTVHHSYESFRTHVRTEVQEEPPEAQPWHPFRTRIDFELAEFMHESHLNQPQITRLLSLVREAAKQPSGLTLFDAADLQKRWEIASKTHQQNMKEVKIKVPYEGNDIELSLWKRDLWDYCTSLLQNEDIVRDFHWHAEKRFRHDGEKWVRFIDEPYTADAWWDIQAKLPLDAVPIFLIVYADKTKLSTMNAKKGYPVYVRCANLPTDIRNGQGLGGGQPIGILPIIPEDTDKSGKRPFVDFKRIVWHKGLEEIMGSILHHSTTGCYIKCGDGIERLVVPIVLILSADYEEQCVMAGIRGLNSYCPCPVCLVPDSKQKDLTVKSESRTVEQMMRAYEDAHRAGVSAETRQAILKEIGLRDLTNVFWKFKYMDVYLALSWDRLHAFHGGLFSDHLLSEFLELLKLLGREYMSQIEANLRRFPTWRGLCHFDELARVREFSDGRKYEDLGKILVFSALNVIDPDVHPWGFQLLRLIRSYIELDMYASLRVHTDKTIAAGREEVQRFNAEREAYTALRPSKNFNFPKAHSIIHLFDNIKQKGVTRNFNTKIFEKMHHILKIVYQHGNFREVEQQIARFNSTQISSLLIRGQIDYYDYYHSNAAQAAEESKMNLEECISIAQSQGGLSSHLAIGSPIPHVPLSQLSDHFPTEYGCVFTNICAKLSTRLTEVVGELVRLPADIEVTLYRYAKVQYTSFEDSTLEADLLRMNKNFYKKGPRYDSVLISVYGGKFVIGKLMGIIGVMVGSREVPLALVVPYDIPIRVNNDDVTHKTLKRDRDLRMLRFRSRNLRDSCIINPESITRGMLMFQDSGSHTNYKDNYLAVDVVDPDCWLRLKELESANLFMTSAQL